MTAASLLIRADASVAAGTGHVMRCLALAQAWQDAGGRAAFAMAESTSSVQERLAGEGCEIVSVSAAAGSQEDAGQTIVLARQQFAEWIVVDGYQFGADYQRTLKAAGFKLLFLDDYGHARHYSADVVLNQNVCANAASYEDRDAQTRLLLGPRYCLLRREFAAWRNWKRQVPPVCQRVLVLMGGSDPDNVTARVLDALALGEFQNIEATVVVGGSNPHGAILQRLAAHSGRKIMVRRNVSNMAELMAAADIAVSAAGSTCWELCLLGLPTLLLDVAANQTALATELDRRGCAVRVGDETVSVEKMACELGRLLTSLEVRQSLSLLSRELVDGKGAGRVVSVLRGEARRGDAGLRLRRARAEDSQLLWMWANDPEVRAASFSTAPISWQSHIAWFAGKLSQDASPIFIAEDEAGRPCGQIRFDVRPGGEWEVDVSIAKAMRGQGLASELIDLGVQAILTRDHNAQIHAFVKTTNTASIKAFAKADFRQIRAELIRGDAAIHLIYRKVNPANP